MLLMTLPEKLIPMRRKVMNPKAENSWPGGHGGLAERPSN